MNVHFIWKQAFGARIRRALALVVLLLGATIAQLGAAHAAPPARSAAALGDYLQSEGEPRFAPAQLADEGWDDRFGPPGVYDGDVEAATVSDSGNLYVAGRFFANESGVEANHIARWDGRGWHALGGGLSGDVTRVRKLAAHGSNVYAVGTFTQAGNVTANQIARWDGSQWHALGSGVGPQFKNSSGTPRLYTVAAAPNGDVYVGGTFDHIDDVPANGVARWDGAQWRALGAGLADRGVIPGDERFPAWVYALAVATDGSLYAGGQFSDAGDVSARNIARWDGAQWRALGGGVGGGDIFDGNQVRAIAVDGAKVYAGGSFTTAGGSTAANIAVWNGTSWQPLGTGVFSELSSPAPVLSLMVKDGALYAGGALTAAGGKQATGLARWDGSQWSAVGTPLAITGARVVVSALANEPQGGLFVGGTFEKAGEVNVYGITHWNGQQWESLGQGVAAVGDISAVVNAVAVDAAGRVYVGGMINMVGGLPVSNIAMWDGSRWHDMDGGVTGGPDGVVSAILAVGNDVYVGGQFTQAGGKSASRIAKWDSTTQTWSALGSGIDGWVMSLAYGDGVLYAGGSFKQAGSAPVNDVAAWSAGRWSALGGDYEIYEILDSGNEAGTFVQALAYHNGELFMGGYFKTIHEKAKSTQDENSYVWVHNVVGYTVGAQQWFTIGEGGAMGVTTNGLSTISTRVYALAVANNGLYIGGTFNRGGGLLTPNLARWDLRTGAWSSPGVPSAQGDVSVRTLRSLGSRLLVGGQFTSIDDLPARSIALLDTATNSWEAFGSGVTWRNGTARVNALASASDAVYSAGEFSRAGAHPSLGFARYQGDFTPDMPEERVYSLYLPFSVR